MSRHPMSRVADMLSTYMTFSCDSGILTGTFGNYAVSNAPTFRRLDHLLFFALEQV